MLYSSTHVALAEKRNRCIGVMAASDFALAKQRLIYIETLLVSERHHGTNIVLRLIGALFGSVVHEAGSFPDIVAMKTHTPRAYVLMRGLATGDQATFYPAIPVPSPEGEQRRAARITTLLDPGRSFRPETGVVAGGGGTIGSDFWPKEQLTRDATVNDFFATEVGAHDRVLCVVSCETAPAKKQIAANIDYSSSGEFHLHSSFECQRSSSSAESC